MNSVEELYEARRTGPISKYHPQTPWNQLSEAAKLEYTLSVLRKAAYASHDDAFLFDGYVHDAYELIKTYVQGKLDD